MCKFTFDVSEEEEDDGGECELPATLLSALEGIDSVRTYFTKFDVSDNVMAALISFENGVYRIK
jgi:hypothetical protein